MLNADEEQPLRHLPTHQMQIDATKRIYTRDMRHRE